MKTLHDEKTRFPMGGGYVVFLSGGHVPVFQGIVFTNFFQNVASKEGNFCEAGCQNMSKDKFSKIGSLFSLILAVWSILFTYIFWNRVSFEGKILPWGAKKTGLKKFSWAHPSTDLGQGHFFVK